MLLLLQVPSLSFVPAERGLQPEGLHPHAASLRQAFAHCAIFPLLPPVESGPCLSPSVAGRPLRPATRRRLGRPLPHQLADRPRAHPDRRTFHHHRMSEVVVSVLAPLSRSYPRSQGRLPVLLTRSPLIRKASSCFTVRLACVKHAASVRPEPGSNSPVNVVVPCGDLRSRKCEPGKTN